MQPCVKKKHRAMMRLALVVARLAAATRGCVRTVDQCRASYPELLGRIDRDLAPWRASGITRAMTERRLAEMRETNPQLNGVVVVEGTQVSGRGGYHQRADVAHELVARSLSYVCGVPPLPRKFLYTTSDHAPQDQLDNASATPETLAPLAIWCKRSSDALSVLAPEGSFWANGDGIQRAPVNATAFGDQMEAAAVPWANRTDRLWFRGTVFRGGGHEARARVSNLANRPDVNPKYAAAVDIVDTRKGVSAAAQCRSKYLLYLHGGACSGRLKNLLRCGSVVVFPERAGGLDNDLDRGDVEYEEFFYDRLVVPNETVLRPRSVDDLAETVAFLRTHDDVARAIGERSRARAVADLSVDAALCYWATLLSEVAALQARGARRRLP